MSPLDRDTSPSLPLPFSLSPSSVALPRHPTLVRRNLEFAELIFNLVFTGEVILRLLYHEGARNYLRHPWNVFDLVMVLAGYTSFLPQSDSTGNMSALRALRALRAMRPLRTVTRFQSLKVVVVSFMDSVPMLVQVVLLMFFIMMLFAISGLSLFQEAFHRQCYDPVSMEFEVAYGPSPDEFGCGGTRSCPESHPVCGYKSTGRGQVMAGFDNLGTSTLSVFQVITLGGWSFMMYRVVDNTSWAFSLWFVVLVLFGAYFAVNLFLAVLKLKFGKAQQTFTEKLRQKAKKKKQSNITKAFGFVKRNINKVVERRKEKVRLSIHATKGRCVSEKVRLRLSMHATKGRCVSGTKSKAR